MKKISIGVLNHSINIGNHFFEISIMEELKKVFGDTAAVFPVEGRHFYSDLLLSANARNYLNYGEFTTCDFLVISGPIFQYKTLRQNFLPLFERMYRNGTKIIYLSAGSSCYSDEEVSDVRKFLADYPPYVISTRDQFTFDAYHDLAAFSHNGICSAFFSSFHYSGYDTPELGKYIILNFEDAPEPQLDKIDFTDFRKTSFVRSEIEKSSHTTKSETIRNFFNFRQARIGNHLIVRPLHNFTPSLMKPILHRSNQFVSVNPYAYLNLYSRCDLVLARRVHACVPALSYGKAAMLFNSTRRSKLFERVGLSDITHKPVVLDKQLLHEKHDAFVEFLRKVQTDILS